MKTCGMCKNRKKCREFGIYGPLSNYAERCKKFEERLKPCPHCGGENIQSGSRENTFGIDIYIKCDNCGAKVQICSEFGEDELIRRWNRRAKDE